MITLKKNLKEARKMLRILLMLVALAAMIMVDAKQALPVCKFSREADEAEITVPLTEEEATAALDKSGDKENVLSSSGAKRSRKVSLGPIIAFPKPLSCPKYRLFYWQPQELCPSSRVKVYSLYSGAHGFCYVLFPHWQNIYENRCLCRNCRINCLQTNNNFRHRCVRDPKPYVNRTVWAICYRSRHWQIRRFSNKFSYGQCNCKTYYTGGCIG